MFHTADPSLRSYFITCILLLSICFVHAFGYWLDETRAIRDGGVFDQAATAAIRAAAIGTNAKREFIDRPRIKKLWIIHVCEKGTKAPLMGWYIFDQRWLIYAMPEEAERLEEKWAWLVPPPRDGVGVALRRRKRKRCAKKKRGRVVVVAHVNLRWNWPRFSRRDGIQCDECRRFECLWGLNVVLCAPDDDKTTTMKHRLRAARRKMMMIMSAASLPILPQFGGSLSDSGRFFHYFPLIFFILCLLFLQI